MFRRVTRNVVAAAAVLALSGLLTVAACGGDNGAAGAHAGHGVIQSVDPERGQVTIDHEEIPGFMGAMTMTFEVKDPGLLEGLDAGAEVDFRVKEEGGRYVVTELRPKP